MDVLNNDCQQQIIKYLDLTDQLNLFEVTKDMEMNRLNSNIKYAWQHQLSFYVDEKHFKVFELKPKLFHDFLSIISPTVQQLTLWDISTDGFKLWKNYKFPEIISLEYRLQVDCGCYNNKLIDNYNNKFEESKHFIQLMPEIFPELNTIKPGGIFDIIHLQNCTNLRKLDLSNCYPVSESEESAKGIQGLLNLEELSLGDDNLSEEHFQMLLRLPKLKSLELWKNGLALRRITEMQPEIVEKVEKIDVYCKNLSDLSFIGKFKKLRQVTLRDLNDIFLILASSTFIPHLPLLQRLDLLSFDILGSEAKFWQIVDSCPSLKFLNVQVRHLHRDFFSEDREHMQTVLNKRSTPLTLHWHNTLRLSIAKLYLWDPKKLRASFEPFKTEKIYRFAKFDFYSSNTEPEPEPESESDCKKRKKHPAFYKYIKPEFYKYFEKYS